MRCRLRMPAIGQIFSRLRNPDFFSKVSSVFIIYSQSSRGLNLENFCQPIRRTHSCMYHRNLSVTVNQVTIFKSQLNTKCTKEYDYEDDFGKNC